MPGSSSTHARTPGTTAVVTLNALHLERVTTSPCWSVSRAGVEPTASLFLREGGLPVAYRAAVYLKSARRESNPPRRFGRPGPNRSATGTYPAEGEGADSKAHRSPGFEPGAVAHRLDLPFPRSIPRKKQVSFDTRLEATTPIRAVVKGSIGPTDVTRSLGRVGPFEGFGEKNHQVGVRVGQGRTSADRSPAWVASTNRVKSDETAECIATRRQNHTKREFLLRRAG
jgi:hypothetical protein